MAYRVDVTARVARNLKSIFQRIHAEHLAEARAWFEGLEVAVFSLAEYPERGKATPELSQLRQLTYGHKPHVYRVIYRVDKRARQVIVLHIRHSARDALKPADIG
jgi:plasmid stabilization system protein ParE